MKLLQKLPDSQRSPPGLEWKILRQLPLALAAGTAIPALCYLAVYLGLAPVPAEGAEKYLNGVAITATAVVITVWTAAFTIAIGCLVVVLMKGPAYVADRYPLIDADEPRRTPEQDPERED